MIRISQLLAISLMLLGGCTDGEQVTPNRRPDVSGGDVHQLTAGQKFELVVSAVDPDLDDELTLELQYPEQAKGSSLTFVRKYVWLAHGGEEVIRFDYDFRWTPGPADVGALQLAFIVRDRAGDVGVSRHYLTIKP
jgi:hypothetical protein